VKYEKVKTVVVVFAALCVVTLLGACSSSEYVDAVKEQPYEVSMIGVGPADSGTTFGAAVESYCPGGKWEQGTAADGTKLVNYTGGDAREGSMDIQWIQDNNGHWRVYAMEIDGSAVSMAQINTIFAGV
jgi:hypothetical protein